MDTLRWARRPDELRRPVMIAAFEGWNDAGDAATMAARHLAGKWAAHSMADLDPEIFYDFTSTRPHVRLENGLTRKIDWPKNEFLQGTISGTNRDAIVVVGVEPQLRWRTYCTQIVDVAKTYGVETVITLGALLADVPHTRTVRITGTATDDDMVNKLALQRSRYEGPTGIVGVLHDFLSQAGLGSASLWAAVPHYLPGTPSPKAALALVERAATMLRTKVPVLELQIATAQYERQVNEVVEADDDMRGYVRQLEAGQTDDDDDDTDDEPGVDLAGATAGSLTDEYGNVPSGDALAEELERFLRDQAE